MSLIDDSADAIQRALSLLHREAITVADRVADGDTYASGVNTTGYKSPLTTTNVDGVIHYQATWTVFDLDGTVTPKKDGKITDSTAHVWHIESVSNLFPNRIYTCECYLTPS